jgi:hypothetical protein
LKSQLGKGVRGLSTPPAKFAQLVTSITVRGPGMPYARMVKNGFAFGVEAKMQKVSSVFAYVVNDGRVCALKPSEWSILLTGVALCGVVTMVVLLARV